MIKQHMLADHSRRSKDENIGDVQLCAPIVFCNEKKNVRTLKKNLYMDKNTL